MSLATKVVDALLETDEQVRRIALKAMPTHRVADHILALAQRDVDEGWYAEVRQERDQAFKQHPHLWYYTRDNPGLILALGFTVRLGQVGLDHAEHMANYNLKKWKQSRSRKKGPPPELEERRNYWEQSLVERLGMYAWKAGLDFNHQESLKLGPGLWRVVISGIYPANARKPEFHHDPYTPWT